MFPLFFVYLAVGITILSVILSILFEWSVVLIQTQHENVFYQLLFSVCSRVGNVSFIFLFVSTLYQVSVLCVPQHIDLIHLALLLFVQNWL
jgi:hypothetical protein